jgi:hypothetical protein
MSVNYNKSKATAFNGLGVYSDNYDSLNNTITISNPSGNTTILGTVNINSVSNNNETVKINFSTGSDSVIGGKLTINDELHCTSNIYCNNIYSNVDVLFSFKYCAILYINTLVLPIHKSNYNLTNFYTNLNLQNLLNTNTCNILIHPKYSISFYNANNTLLQTINNTNGTDLLYNSITLSSTLVIKFIVKYNNNII